MVILIAVGVMNMAAMIGLAAVVLIEKTWRWGPAVGTGSRCCRAGRGGSRDLASLAGTGPARRAAGDDLTDTPTLAFGDLMSRAHVETGRAADSHELVI